MSALRRFELDIYRRYDSELVRIAAADHGCTAYLSVPIIDFVPRSCRVLHTHQALQGGRRSWRLGVLGQ